MQRPKAQLGHHLLTRSDLAALAVRATDVFRWLADGAIEQVGDLPRDANEPDPVFAVNSEPLRAELVARLAGIGKTPVVLTPLGVRSFLLRTLLLGKRAGEGREAEAAAHDLIGALDPAPTTPNQDAHAASPRVPGVDADVAAHLMETDLAAVLQDALQDVAPDVEAMLQLAAEIAAAESATKDGTPWAGPDEEATDDPPAAPPAPEADEPDAPEVEFDHGDDDDDDFDACFDLDELTRLDSRLDTKLDGGVREVPMVPGVFVEPPTDQEEAVMADEFEAPHEGIEDGTDDSHDEATTAEHGTPAEAGFEQLFAPEAEPAGTEQEGASDDAAVDEQAIDKAFEEVIQAVADVIEGRIEAPAAAPEQTDEGPSTTQTGQGVEGHSFVEDVVAEPVPVEEVVAEQGPAEQPAADVADELFEAEPIAVFEETAPSFDLDEETPADEPTSAAPEPIVEQNVVEQPVAEEVAAEGFAAEQVTAEQIPAGPPVAVADADDALFAAEPTTTFEETATTFDPDDVTPADEATPAEPEPIVEQPVAEIEDSDTPDDDVVGGEIDGPTNEPGTTAEEPETVNEPQMEVEAAVEAQAGDGSESNADTLLVSAEQLLEQVEATVEAETVVQQDLTIDAATGAAPTAETPIADEPAAEATFDEALVDAVTEAVEARVAEVTEPVGDEFALTSQAMDKVQDFLGELRSALVEMAQRPQPQSTTPAIDVAPLIEAVQAGFDRSAEQATQASTALASLAERVGQFGQQVEASVQQSVRALAEQQQHLQEVQINAPVAVADRPRFLVQRPGRQALVLGAVAILVVCWSILFWFKTGSPRLAFGTLIGANLVGCCLLVARRD